ncbi:MAG: hypothetical protein ACTSRA_16580 [Promethearchaeota archaeon]
MIDVIYDMDTGDPDDSIALLILLSHKKVKVRAVTLYPGSKDQIGFVKHILNQVDKPEIPVGSYDINNTKSNVSEGLIKMYGNFTPKDADAPGHKLFSEFYKRFPKGISINTAPLGNLYSYLKKDPNKMIEVIYVQGGFAGARCIPLEFQLDRFKGFNEFPHL